MVFFLQHPNSLKSNTTKSVFLGVTEFTFDDF